jgi:hypothetical protein
MPRHHRTVRLQQGLWEKNTTRRVEIFLPNRRSEPLQLSHPQACTFALCMSDYEFDGRNLFTDMIHFNFECVAQFCICRIRYFFNVKAKFLFKEYEKFSSIYGDT